MALTLALRQGHDFYVGDSRLIISKIFSSTEFLVRLPNDRCVRITDGEWLEALPHVNMRAGIPEDLDYKEIIRLLIDAPRSIKVLRGDLYREKQQDPEKARRRIHGTE